MSNKSETGDYVSSIADKPDGREITRRDFLKLAGSALVTSAAGSSKTNHSVAEEAQPDEKLQPISEGPLAYIYSRTIAEVGESYGGVGIYAKDFYNEDGIVETFPCLVFGKGAIPYEYKNNPALAEPEAVAYPKEFYIQFDIATPVSGKNDSWPINTYYRSDPGEGSRVVSQSVTTGPQLHLDEDKYVVPIVPGAYTGPLKSSINDPRGVFCIPALEKLQKVIDLANEQGESLALTVISIADASSGETVPGLDYEGAGTGTRWQMRKIITASQVVYGPGEAPNLNDLTSQAPNISTSKRRGGSPQGAIKQGSQ